jgi:2'-5' RNA ligase
MKKPESRIYTPHITLGRIRVWEFRQIEPEERPDIEKEISLSFQVNSIEVMESQLKRGGSEYTILKSCPLKS